MKINFNNIIAKIKPMHAINNAPLTGAADRLFHFMGEAGIPYSRLHDTGGAYGQNRFVDIANVFRNFDADENDPASYDFAFTDWLLNTIDKQNTKIFYRLGASIENGQKIKAYNIYPPKENLKWAKICEKIIAHYNEGWANGFKMGIEYWEIWNEPDNQPCIADNPMWKGTFEEYMELYKTVAPYLKEKFPYIKIGGYASCGFYSLFEKNFATSANSSSRTEYFVECFHKFMKFVKENNLPLDFFSWHSYSDVKKNVAYEEYVHRQLAEYGYSSAESILNEWNPDKSKRGTLEDSANISDAFLTMQNTTVDMLMYYDGQVNGTYCGMFNPVSYEPFKAYYAFKGFSELYRLENQVQVSQIPEDMSCVAAANEVGKAVMLVNKGEKRAVKIDADCGGEFSVYRLNDSLNLEADGKITSGGEIEVDRFETIVFKC